MAMGYSFAGDSWAFRSLRDRRAGRPTERTFTGASIVIRTSIGVAAFICALASAGPAHAGDAEAGKAKAVVCSACHGIDGNSINPLWPNLAGQHAAYLAKQMKAFRSGERKDPVMAPMAMGLSDADIDDLAAFYAGQKPK